MVKLRTLCAAAFAVAVMLFVPEICPAYSTYGRIKDNPAGAYIGAYVSFEYAGLPARENDTFQLNNYETNIGRHLSTVLWFQAWGASSPDFPSSSCEATISRGALPIITWEPWKYTNPDADYTLQKIIDGNYDVYITNWATAAKNFRYPVFLRFAHEMNGNWYPWSGASNGADSSAPAKYISAWRRVHSIFDSVGATNVTWVWCVNSDSVPTGTAWNTVENYYPGDSYVDWIAVDGYNWGGGSWNSFDTIFSSVYTTLKTSHPGKPIMIGEMGCAETGGNKASWITDAFSKIKEAGYNGIKAYNWFNTKKETDWEIESSVSATTAMYNSMSDTSKYLHKVYLPALSISSLTGGDKIAGGSGRPITWTSSFDTSVISSEGVSIYYSTDGGSTFPHLVAANLPDTGTYTWTVPSLNTSLARIKVSASNSIGNSVSSISDSNIMIDSIAPAVNLLSPVGGEKWGAGTTKIVRWNASDSGSGIPSNGISIYYSTDGGATFPNTMASGISNSGIYYWTLPSVASDTVRVKMSAVDAAGNTSFVTSGSDLSIGSTFPASPGVDPVITPTNVASQTIAGTMSADSVLIQVNGTTEGISYPSSGRWSANVLLTAGENTFEVVSKNSLGYESSTVVVRIVLQDLDISDATTGVTIKIPVGASTSVPVISTGIYSAAPSLGVYPAGRSLVGNAVNIDSTVTSFSIPITITMTIPSGAIDPQPYFWDSSTLSWSNSGISLTGATASNITFTTSHLSIFAVFGISGSLSGIAVYPNPFRIGSGPGVVFDGLAGSETIRIYTISGELVNSGTLSGAHTWTWTASNSSGNTVSRGVYIYLIRDTSGQKRIGKIAVTD